MHPGVPCYGKGTILISPHLTLPPRSDLVDEMLKDQLPEALKPFQMNYEYYPNVGFTLGSQIQLAETTKEPKVGG